MRSDPSRRDGRICIRLMRSKATSSRGTSLGAARGGSIAAGVDLTHRAANLGKAGTFPVLGLMMWLLGAPFLVYTPARAKSLFMPTHFQGVSPMIDYERWCRSDRVAHPGVRLRRDHAHCEPARRWFDNPWVIDGTLVYVSDVDAHYENAKLHGATILSPPEEGPPARRYRVEDLEGHRWMFMAAPSVNT